ncbi:MAG: family 2 glycosyl transferase [Desulfobacterales bacterium]|nr:MAG: family 2 glycosyl transferase [Desulfobacterales bacterium]
MDLSIVILSWNSLKHLQNCLRSISTSLSGSELKHEIIVVENGSTDNTVEYLKNISPPIRDVLQVIYLSTNVGTTVSRNLAFNRANGKYIAVLDSDVEVNHQVFPNLIKKLEENHKIGLIAPRLYYPGGILQKSTDVFPSLFTKIRRFFFLKQIEKKEAAITKNLEGKTVDYAISAFWLFRKSILENVGLLDENIFYAPEDVDFCLRIWKEGFTVYYEPMVHSIHHTQEISRGVRFNRAFFEHLKGLLYYFQKHKYIIRRPSF